jgi:hypothetical protein
MNELFDNIKNCYINTLLKELIKNINSDEEKGVLLKILSKYEYEASGDIDSRVCCKCGEIKNNKLFHLEQIGSDRNNKKISHICNDCYEWHILRYRISSKIFLSMPDKIEVSDKLIQYIWGHYCDKCTNVKAFNDFWDLDEEPNGKCINCNVFPLLEYAKIANNHRCRDINREKIIDNILTEEYKNMFLLLSKTKRYLLKLKKENYETS